MLRWAPPSGPSAPEIEIDRVQGDAGAPPFRPQSFGAVALLGNALGFAGATGPRLLEAVSDLVAPQGLLLLELAPGPGEHARYFARLPPTAVGRLLRAPPPVVLPRVRREGYASDPPRKEVPGEFQRYDPKRLLPAFRAKGWNVRETLAVAPSLGSLPDHVEAVRADPKAWERLLLVEETLGREPGRWSGAAAVLLAVARPPAA